MGDVLVDTSVWIDFFRSVNSPHAKALDRLLEEGRVCTCKLIMAEVIPGAPTERQYEELRDYFKALPVAPEPDDIWERVMDARHRLCRRGVYKMGIPDLMVAVTAHANDKAVFTKDVDFSLIQKVLPFRLFVLSSSKAD